MRSRLLIVLLPLFFVLGSVRPTAAQTPPPPPEPVGSSGGMLSIFPGHDAPDRRDVASFDLGLALTGNSPVGWAGRRRSLVYLGLGGTFGNEYVYFDANTMFLPLVIDALLGVGLLNLNVLQGDDFPPFIRTFNDHGGTGGVWEFGSGLLQLVVSSSEDRFWAFGFETHISLLNRVEGASAGIVLGGGPALTYGLVEPTWEWTTSVFSGPEIGSPQGIYAGLSTTYRRAVAVGFAPYVRYVYTAHFLFGTGYYGAGQIELGFAFGNWK